MKKTLVIPKLQALQTFNASLYRAYRLYIKPLVKIDENKLEEFILKNKDKFNDNQPSERHVEHFLYKFNLRIRHFISIVPHLLKVVFATMIIFLASIIVWNNYLRKDRDQITFKDRISLTLNQIREFFQ